MMVRTLEQQIKRKDTEFYIVLLKTFGIISVLIPLSLLFILEMMWDPSLQWMMSAGVFLLVVAFIWNWVHNNRR